MLTKIEITGTIESVTGMHIGGSSSFAAIGAVDSPVIRDVYSDEPMIPGSTLKGKMRYLLSRQYAEGSMPVQISEEDDRIRRLFGYTSNGKGEEKTAHASRLQFSDMFLQNGKELKEMGIQNTEVKFENTINRITAVANPRQIERSVKGAKYDLSIVYDMVDAAQVVEDFQTISEGLKLLEYDYIGGSGSRGYGKIRFEDMDVSCVLGDCDEALLEQCEQLIKDVEK